MPRILTDTQLDQILGDLKTEKQGVLMKSKISLENNSKVLVVSIGGMGSATLIRLKKELRSSVGEIDGSQIRFLAIDTAKIELKNAVSAGELGEDEICKISNVHGLQGEIKPDTEYVPLSIRSIVPEAGFLPRVNDNGAGQIRLAGRIAALDPANRVKITNKVEGALSKFGDLGDDQDLSVYIVGGLSGGTGSGLCIDVPYLIRNIAEKCIPADQIKIYAHFYLPNAYDAGTNTKKQETFYRNGYAALKEIDYYMNIEELREKYELRLGEGANNMMSSARNIFDLCTVIAGQSNVAGFAQNRQKNAINACVQNLVNRVTQASTRIVKDGAEQHQSVDVFTVDAQASNIPNALNGYIRDPNLFLTANASYKYSCAGVAALRFPSDAIIDKYLKFVFCDKAYSQWAKNANDLTEDEFSKFSNLTTPETIVDSLIETFFASAYDEQIQDTLLVPGNNQNNFHDACSKLMNTVNSQIQPRHIKDAVDEAIQNLMSTASTIFKDADKGPLYLERLLYDDTNGYFNIVQDYNTMCLDKAEATSSNSELDILKKTAIPNNFLGFGANAVTTAKRNYLSRAKKIYADMLRAKLYDKLSKHGYKNIITDLDNFYNTITQKFNDHFVYKIDLIHHLNSILSSNEASSAQHLNPSPESDSILAVNASAAHNPLHLLRQKVDATINDCIRKFDDTKVKRFMSAFATDMISNQGNWVIDFEQPDRTNCVDSFRGFINNRYNDPDFHSMVTRTLSDYMEDAYGNDDVKMGDAVYSIVNRLNNTASPMFNTWTPDILTSLESLRLQHIMVPAKMLKESKWKDKFENAIGVGDMNAVFEGSDPNTVYKYISYARLPLWLHKDLPEYEKVYNAHYTDIGTHTNESAENNFRNLPSLFIPEQRFRYKQIHHNDYVDEKEDAFRNKLKEQLERAKKFGILSQDAESKIFAISYIDRSAVNQNIDDFVKQYASDHYDARQKCFMLGQSLYSAFIDRFKGKTAKIESYHIGHEQYNASNETELISMLRRQIRTAKALKAELDYIEKTYEMLYQKLKEKEKELLYQANMERFSQYIGFGLISFDAYNTWNCKGYKLVNGIPVVNADLDIPIVTSASVSTDKDAAQKGYDPAFMERPAFDYFFKDDKYALNQIASDKEVERLTNLPTQQLEVYRETYDGYVSRFDGILTNIRNRAQLGLPDALDSYNQKFYGDLSKAFKKNFRFLAVPRPNVAPVNQPNAASVNQPNATPVNQPNVAPKN